MLALSPLFFVAHYFPSVEDEVGFADYLSAHITTLTTLRSLNRNAFPDDTAGYLIEEVAGGVIEIQLEGTTVHIAAVAQSKRLTEVDGSEEVSVRVIVPHAVSERVSPSRPLPHT
jgi:hypothetical protein